MTYDLAKASADGCYYWSIRDSEYELLKRGLETTKVKAHAAAKAWIKANQPKDNK